MLLVVHMPLPFPLSLQYEPMIRLVSQYHADLLIDTHLLLAKV